MINIEENIPETIHAGMMSHINHKITITKEDKLLFYIFNFH